MSDIIKANANETEAQEQLEKLRKRKPQGKGAQDAALAKAEPKEAIAPTPKPIESFQPPDVQAPQVPPQAIYDATYSETAQLAQNLGDVRKQAVADALRDNAEAIKRDADSFRSESLQSFADWLIG